MHFDLLTFDVVDRIATVTLSRSDKLNALNDALIGDIGRAVDEVRKRAEISGMIITGAGRAFAAGADVAEMAGQTPLTAVGRARRGQGIFRSLERLKKPVIAAVNGFALGGGLELALACHLRVASSTAEFGQPEVTLGIMPGFGGTQRLPRLVGKGIALGILLSGERIKAEEAFRIGLVNAVVAPEELMLASRLMMAKMLLNAPLAIALCLEAVDRGMDSSLDDGLLLEANDFGLLAATEDAREGTTAFLEKRPAKFQGK